MSADSHAVVFAAAIAEIAARGVAGASLSAIARRAEVRVATLEAGYGGKDALLRSALQAAAREHAVRACVELPPGPAVEQLRNFCGRSWDILNTPAHAALFRLMVSETPRHSDLAGFYADEVYGMIRRHLHRIIERGIVAGDFRRVPAAAMARMIFASLLMQAFWCSGTEAVEAGTSDCHRVVADTLSIVLDGLRPAQSPGL